jgi:hypothetical protein
MIEMNVHEDPLGDDPDDYPAYQGRVGELWRLAFSAPSLAIASLVISFASLTVIQAADEIGETALFSSSSNNPSNFTEIRVSAAVRLVIAVFAIGIAIASGVRLLATEEDDEAVTPLWVRAVAGAGFVVALVAVIVSAGSLIYALQAHTAATSGFN